MVSVASTSVRTFSSLAFHAERLEDTDVWQHTKVTLTFLERHGVRCTLFIHPYSAIRAGVDLGDRIRELNDRGHEVAQHTHFYAVVAKPGKPPTDLSERNIRRCLDRDLVYLTDAGGVPRGFTSGAWVRHPAVDAWLRETGFAYDCTSRTFPLRYASSDVDPAPGDRRAGHSAGVVGLPTTTSVSDVVRRLPRRRPTEPLTTEIRYELMYLHDYDLLHRRTRAAVRAAIWSRRSAAWRTADELAESIGAAP